MSNLPADNSPDEPAEQMTRLLGDIAQGREGALAELFPLVYGELRKMAAVRMAAEREDHTLQPTALVHEAYFRLVGKSHIEWKSRAHFFHAAAEAMRRILIDHARARDRLKRGHGIRRELQALESVADLAESANFEQIVAVDHAVRRLEEMNPEVGGVVRLRFYAGLNPEETGQALGLSPRTVFRHWAYARAWLYRELSSHC